MKHTGKRMMTALALLAAMVLAAGCARTPVAPSTPTDAPATAIPATAAPAVTPQQATPTPTATAVAPTATAVPETPALTAAPTHTPAPKGPKMYSSYADLVSFDPDTGIAKFDYFDMLTGDKAVKYLVEHDGYSKAKAQETVDNFADSEYIKKNQNSQLRAIDLDDVPLKLMFQTNGEQVNTAKPIKSTAKDFRTIYALDTSLLLETFFYYIHVDGDGDVTLVEQAFWP